MQIRRDLLQKAGASTLASLLREEYCEIGGPRLTVHLPGQSWHQWGYAADVFIDVRGIATWRGSISLVLPEAAKKFSLVHGQSLVAHPRAWHLQFHKEDTPLFVRGFIDSWRELEIRMLEDYNLTEIESPDYVEYDPDAALEEIEEDFSE